ncbi:MAG: AAA family ATPase, partial [Actinomycetes bacterium]
MNGYLQRIVDTDLPEAGQLIRRRATLRAWLAAYAASTSTTAPYDAILRAASPGESLQPAKTTTIAWCEALGRLWMLDSVPAWLPGSNHFKELGAAGKHQLADPALAARLLGANASTL